jgi:hypothetical protein
MMLVNQLSEFASSEAILGRGIVRRNMNVLFSYGLRKDEAKTRDMYRSKVAPRPGFGPGSCGRQPHILDRTILPGLHKMPHQY